MIGPISAVRGATWAAGARRGVADQRGCGHAAPDIHARDHSTE